MASDLSNIPCERAFYVVQFVELPFEGIDDYVCVPYTWLTKRKTTDRLVLVAYPKNEDPFDTRDRVIRKERYNVEWKSYMATVKYESNSYNDAEFWIATRNDYGPLVEKISKVTGTPPKLSINERLRSTNQTHLSESNNNFRKPLPKIIKRPAQSELKEELDGKRLKLDECAHSSNAVVNDVQESKISVAPSKETINDNQGTRTDDLSNEPPSHQLLNSPKISAQLYCHMNGGRRLVPTQRPVEKTIQPMKIKGTDTTSPQNLSNLMDRTMSSSTSSVEQQPVVTQNQSRDSLGDQTFKRPQQKQLQPTQQDSQRQLQKPNIRINGVSIKQINNRQAPTLPGVTIKTLSPILTKLVNSVRKAVSTSHNNFLLNNQQFQAGPSVLVNESTLPKVMSNACQRPVDMCTIDETLSPYHAVTSDSDAVTNREVISDYEVSTDEAPAETMNNVYGTANDPGHSSADRPTAAQKTTARRRQINRRFILKQQMLDNFATLFKQMRATFRHTTNMYNTLRSSIHVTAKIYKKVLGAAEQFNAAGNAANEASPSRNPVPDVPQPSEERHITITAIASSSNQDQHSNNIANKTPKNKHKKKLFRFVVPPEYDAYDSRWTLKYPTYLAGLVELVPDSHVYVSYGDLKYCQQVSKDCPSLARRLLKEVFNRNALSVCSTMRETAEAANSVGSNIRSDLDDHACSVLLRFVIEHGLRSDWNTDLKPILDMLHSTMEEIRYKYGIMQIVEC